MICQNCNKYAPDANYKCPSCGTVLDKSQIPTPTAAKYPRKNLSRFFILIVLMVFVGYFIYKTISVSNSNVSSTDTKNVSNRIQAGVNSNSQQKHSQQKHYNDDANESANEDSYDDDSQSDDYTDFPPAHIINSNNPGEVIDIDKYVQEGKTTIFDFYSEFCPPCRQIAPYLKKLDAIRPDIVVLKIDINRKGVRGIDWRSPAAQHFGLRSIPHFVIYSPNRTRTHEGRAAYQEINRLMQKYGVLR